ncbi:MAG: hypothetical protein COU51_04815 [Parcubacteria group bacterium CG10_big_fil_rev_8_21_14_0_10_36_14]|nr:MAG: hypothetical protein COU51_04815 [Parcubacteria group bacterium CG10_big_fil_rev_8_21_14_0_10_36_14]
MLKIAEIIRLSWETYTSKFKQYIPFLGAIFILSALTSLSAVLIDQLLTLPSNVEFLISSAISFLAYLANFVVLIAIIYYTDKFLSNKKPDIKLKDIFTVYWPAILISVLAGFITVGGFILFIIPGIIFTVWYAFAMYLAILQKKKGLELLKESRELSRGKFWPVFGRLVVPNIFWGIIAYLALVGIFNLIGLIIGQSVINLSETGLGLNLVILFVSDLIVAFFAPLYAIVGTIVFREVRK